MATPIIVAASIVGLLVGQLTIGIPFMRLLHRRAAEAPAPATQPAAKVVAVDWSPWPEDRALALLETWRAEV